MALTATDEAIVYHLPDETDVVLAFERTTGLWVLLDGDDPERECEGHESLRGDAMGESVLCDGSCVPAVYVGPSVRAAMDAIKVRSGGVWPLPTSHI